MDYGKSKRGITVCAAEAFIGSGRSNLEGSVLRLWFSFALAGLMVAFSLPFFAIRRFLAGPGSTVASFLPRFSRRRTAGSFEHQMLWASDEFGFEHALQAYEDLIEAHVSTPRMQK